MARPAWCPPAGRLRCSHLEQLGFLVLEQLVDLPDVGVGELLEVTLRPAHLVLAGLAVLHHLVQRVLGVAPDVADGDAAVFGLGTGGLDVLATALLGQLGEDHPDDHPVVAGIHPQVAVPDRLLDRAERVLVERLHDDHARFRHVEGSELIQGSLSAVVFGGYLGEDARVDTASTDIAEVFLGDRDGLVHLLLGLEEGVIDHRYGSCAHTRVPIGSPRTALTTLPGSISSNTTTGSLLSRHRLTAVASITLSPRLRYSP